MSPKSIRLKFGKIIVCSLQVLDGLYLFIKVLLNITMSQRLFDENLLFISVETFYVILYIQTSDLQRNWYAVKSLFRVHRVKIFFWFEQYFRNDRHMLYWIVMAGCGKALVKLG